MDRKTYIAWGALLTAAFCTLGLTGAVGESQARYPHQAAWYTVAQPAEDPVTADTLVNKNQPPLINWVGTLTREGLELPITLNSEKNLSGPLNWKVTHSQYAMVKLSLGATELTDGHVIGLSAGKPTVLTLKIEPTALGLAQRQTTTVDIQITWKDTLTGTFRVELPGGEQGETDPANLELRTIKAFHWEAPFPVKLTADSACRVELAMGEEPFPTGTRFSTDGGNSWHRLCKPEQIPVELPGSEGTSLLLDLSHTPAKGGITLQAGHSRVGVPAVMTPVYELSSPILTRTTPIQIRLTNAWNDCNYDYRVELLTAAEGTAAYVPVDLSNGQLTVTASQVETGPVLTLAAGQTLPQPGTYRLLLRWSRDGICFHQSDITFFVNYTHQTGGAQL